MIVRAHYRPHTRPAFTLVEMLVSTALIMFIMYIIAAAFEKGIEAFRVMKTAGDMQERVRGASTMLRQDLTRQHFGNHAMLSDQRLDRIDWRMPGTPSDDGGYFRIYQGDDSLGPATEGFDPDSSSMRVTSSRGTRHILQFTVRLRPDEYRRDLFFSTDTQGVIGTAPNALCDFSIPDYMRPSYANSEPATSVFTSRWADVAYFLKTLNQTTPGGTPLFGLYRRQKLLAEPKSGSLPSVPAAAAPQLFDVSTWQPNATTLNVNGPKEITVPGRRLGNPFPGATWFDGVYPLAASGPDLKRYEDESGLNTNLFGGDLLLSDVVSFEIKALWDIPTDTTKFINPVFFTTPSPTDNADYPFDYLPVSNNTALSGFRVFDTWSQEDLAGMYQFTGPTPLTPAWNQGYFAGGATNVTIPLRVRMRAVQIKLRIWEPKSQTTRQITIIQDL